MNRKRNLINQLLRRERVDITSSNNRKITKSILIALVVSFLGFTLWNIFNTRLTYSLLFFSAGTTTLFLAAALYLYRHIQAACVKGDAIILKSLDKKYNITPLRSIRKIKTNSFLGVQLTDMVYHLDGTNRRAIIITLARRAATKPERAIKKAIEISLKEKANHKPGSVSAA